MVGEERNWQKRHLLRGREPSVNDTYHLLWNFFMYILHIIVSQHNNVVLCLITKRISYSLVIYFMNKERETIFSVTEIEDKEVKVATGVDRLVCLSLNGRPWSAYSLPEWGWSSEAFRGRTFFKILMSIVIPSLLIQNFQRWGLDICIFFKAL